MSFCKYLRFWKQSYQIRRHWRKIDSCHSHRKYETTNLEYGLNTVGDRKDLIVKFTWTNKVAEWTATVSRKPDVRGFKLDSAIKVPAIDDIKMSIDFAFRPMQMIDLDIKGSFGKKNVGLAAKVMRTPTKIDASLVLTITCWPISNSG